MIINISEAKTQLSKLVDMVFHGEKVVIAKNNLPLVDLVPHQPEGKRKESLACYAIRLRSRKIFLMKMRTSMRCFTEKPVECSHRHP